MSYLIGIDLGGTNIKAASLSLSGDVLSALSCATDDREHGTFPGRVGELVERLERAQGTAARAIGLAAPGLASPDGRSIAIMPGRLHGLQGLHWTSALKSKVPLAVINDAHAALLGEVWRGAAIDCRHVFLLTLGTGVGGAIYSDGKLLRGHIGRAGHLGHISLNANGSPDIIAIPGSLEDAIGECTLASRTHNQFSSTRQLVDEHIKGNAAASTLWLSSVRALACAIAGLINVLDPEVVIIGGGIAKAGRALFEPLNAYLNEFEWRPAGNRVRIVPALLGDNAGAIGAAYHALRESEKNAVS